MQLFNDPEVSIISAWREEAVVYRGDRETRGGEQISLAKYSPRHARGENCPTGQHRSSSVPGEDTISSPDQITDHAWQCFENSRKIGSTLVRKHEKKTHFRNTGNSPRRTLPCLTQKVETGPKQTRVTIERCHFLAKNKKAKI